MSPSQSSTIGNGTSTLADSLLDADAEKAPVVPRVVVVLASLQLPLQKRHLFLHDRFEGSLVQTLVLVNHLHLSLEQLLPIRPRFTTLLMHIEDDSSEVDFLFKGAHVLAEIAIPARVTRATRVAAGWPMQCRCRALAVRRATTQCHYRSTFLICQRRAAESSQSSSGVAARVFSVWLITFYASR